MDFLIQPLSIIIMFVLKQRIINLPKGDLLFSNSSVLALVTAQKSARCIYIYIYIYIYIPTFTKIYFPLKNQEEDFLLYFHIKMRFKKIEISKHS